MDGGCAGPPSVTRSPRPRDLGHVLSSSTQTITDGRGRVMELGQGPPVGVAARAAVCGVQSAVSVELCMAWPDGVGLMAGSIIRAPEARAQKRLLACPLLVLSGDITVSCRRTALARGTPHLLHASRAGYMKRAAYGGHGQSGPRAALRSSAV